MRKKAFVSLICTAMILSGCGADSNTTDFPAPSTPVTAQTDDTGAADSPSATPSADSTARDDAKADEPGNNSSGGNAAAQGNTDTAAFSAADIAAITASSVIDRTNMFTNRDSRTEYDEAEVIRISLSDSGIVTDSANVTVEGSTVTITGEGSYLITGSLSDGMLFVDTDKANKVQLILAGVSISNDDSAAIYVRQADKVFITLAEGTENTLKNGGTYTAIDENNIDSVIFSKKDLTINGNGTMNIQADAGHGIVSKKDLAITGGTCYITAASHGICGKNSVRILDGSFDITSGKDGIHAEDADDAAAGFVYIAGGTFRIQSEGDGISAAVELLIDAGDISIISGGGSVNAPVHIDEFGGFGGGPGGFGGFGGGPGGFAGNNPENAGNANDSSTQTESASETSESQKGIKASGNITIAGGTIAIDAADDTLHGASDLLLLDGSLTLASGDDGIHADSGVIINSGSIDITTSYEGLEAQNIYILGGDIAIVSSDDGLNAAGGNDGSGMGGFRGKDQFASQENVAILISGGKLYVNAGGDGIDSNGSLTISGGEIVVDGPTNSGNGALDYNGTATITGGTVIAIGASGMAENFGSTSTQGCILYNTSSYTAGTQIELLDSDRNVLCSHTAAKSFNSLVVSSPSIVQGETYTLNIGINSAEITMTSLTYGSGSGMGGFGGFGGDRGNKGDKGNKGKQTPPDVSSFPEFPGDTNVPSGEKQDL